MAALIGLFVGALAGKLVFGDWAAALFAVAGFVAGAAISHRLDRDRFRKPQTEPARTSLTGVFRPEAAAPAPPGTTAGVAANPAIDVRVAALERRVADLERALGVAAVPEAARAESEPAAEVSPAPIERAQPRRVEAAIVEPASASPDRARLPPAVDAMASAAPATAGVPPSDVLWSWISGANTLARIGVLVLFIGVGFLLKYAAEHVSVPIELRLAGVAAGGLALLVVGWKLRERRTGYAMSLQGGGVGVLYLTVFAALRLYELIAPVAAFALLFWIAALSSWLAVRQDAISLAALGVVGGFAAPILTSTSAGNHVLLFSYYALLNSGILFIAWFKAWRLLNLLGFVCTFVVGTLWGVTRYRPEHFATTEPFLVLFFLYYVGIAVLYAVRQSVAVRRYVDATIVFGTPLVAAALQHALVRDIEYAMAASALAASALYLALGKWLYDRRRADLRLLVESFLALGVVFATLAVPLALDARWTSGTWALEGAALVWIGLRENRRVPRLFGLVLQLAAGVAFAAGLAEESGRLAATLPLLSSGFVGAALVALAGLFTAWLYRAHDDALDRLERGIRPAVFAWGTLWWIGAVGREIDRWIAPQLRIAVAVAALAANAALFAALARRLRWTIARMPVALTLPALILVAALGVVSAIDAGPHLFAHGGALAWPFAIVVCVVLLHHFERGATDVRPSAIAWSHAGVLWLAVLVGTHEIAWVAREAIAGAPVWPLAAWGLVPAFALACLAALASRPGWPVGANPRAYLVDGAVPIVAWLVLWSLGANVASDGDPAPLPFVPLLNPLDLAQGFVLIGLLAWALGLRAQRIGLDAYVSRELRIGVAALLGFVWLNAIALRTVHHWTGVPYAWDALWRSPLVQATLSLLWTGCALATMVVSNRRSECAGWIAGAVLLGVVVLKLFIVDLSRANTIERIVSFIGVGLLLLLIGYLAPVPSRKEEP